MVLLIDFDCLMAYAILEVEIHYMESTNYKVTPPPAPLFTCVEIVKRGILRVARLKAKNRIKKKDQHFHFITSGKKTVLFVLLSNQIAILTLFVFSSSIHHVYISFISSLAKMASKEEGEGDFMQSLLDGLDETFFASPTPTPKVSSQRQTRGLQTSQESYLKHKEGSDIKTSPLTNKRSISSPTKLSPRKKQTRLKSHSNLGQNVSPFSITRQTKSQYQNLSHTQRKSIQEEDQRFANDLLLLSGDEWDMFGSSFSSAKRVTSSPTNLPVERRTDRSSSQRSKSGQSVEKSSSLPFAPGNKRIPLSETQTKIHEDDQKAANELLTLYLDDWDDLELSPKKKPLQEKDSDTIFQIGSPGRYVRCRVDYVNKSTYIPERYQNATPGKYSTKGVKTETVEANMRRKQIVLDLTQLGRTGEEGEDCSSERLSIKRKAYLRDEWLQTYILPGDIVHFIGTWSTPNLTRSPRKSPHRVEIALEDEDVDDIALTPVSSTSPFIILSSETFSSTHSGSSEADNLLILQPDILLSATAISSVVTCARKPLLQAKIKQSGPALEDKPTEALVMGRMLHEVLQSCLTGKSKQASSQFKEEMQEHTFATPSTFPVEWAGPGCTNFSESFVKQQIVAQVRSSLDDLLHAGMDTIKAMDRLWEATLPFGPFSTTYLGRPAQYDPMMSSASEANSQAEAIDRRSAISPLVRVVEIHDVEEDIWSPMYGLKGFVDISVEVRITERGSSRKDMPKGAIPCTNTTTSMMPLELKTGRSINMIEHRAQTMLYTLMMSDRYRRQIDCGLLYYSKSAELHIIRTAKNEIRGLILARNELASHMSRKQGNEEDAVRSYVDTMTRSDLPATIDDERTCSRCYVSEACMLYRKAELKQQPKDEEDISSDWPLATLFDRHTSHLRDIHIDFFKHWDYLLSLEEADTVKHRREMWTMTASARERAGRCYANMVLSTRMPTGSQYEQAKQLNGMNQFIIYGFKRAKGTTETPLLGGNFSVGDAICISIEPSLLSIAQGFLLELSPDHILVGVDKSLEPILKRAGERQKAIFRIDREEQVSGMARIRYNLAKLFFAPPAGDGRRRELIVDLEKPKFSDDQDLLSSKAVLQEMKGELNVDQLGAIRKVLSAEDYALIVGMPGTGKTTTIANLITLLARKGKSVLLASYTHSAVDTICRKLVDVEGVNLLRLGNSDRVHIDVQSKMLKESATVEQLQARLLEPNVVATTCLSIGHTIFALRNSFDYCIIDEASQITLPACIGPLRYAHKFVLVGDPHQLPPLVRDSRARQGGLGVSLFERLQRAHPNAVIHLCHQYRMNADIMSLSNTLTYQGRLCCGNENVAASFVRMPFLEKSMRMTHSNPQSVCSGRRKECWIEKCLSEQTKALFINTQDAHAYEQRTGDLVENLFEAKMVWQLCFALLCGGIDAKEIAVLTPYRQQIRRISALLQQTTNVPEIQAMKGVEIWTADKAQGRDKDIVIVSLVRSQATEDDGNSVDSINKTSSIGQLLYDVRRINVSLTRARKKLIILGNQNTLSNVPMLSRLWSTMYAKNWTVNLSGEQSKGHKEFEDSVIKLAQLPPSSSPVPQSFQ